MVSSAAVYAPMPMKAALAMASMPQARVSQMERASKALVPSVSTRLP